jgi:metallo-beta-lactamase family protein
MLGRYVPVEAEVVDLAGFSVHADADELVAWVRSGPATPGAVYVVHGEANAAGALATRVASELRCPTVVPSHGERVRL